MTINDYLRVLRRRWITVGACALIGVAIAVGFVARAIPQYQASAQLFVAARDGNDLSTLAQGGQFTQQRVQSYADIIDSPQVTGPVAAQFGGGLTALGIAREVSASAPLNTVLINVHVTDPSASRAQALANAVSAQFAKYAAQLETTPGSATSPVKVTVVKRAELPTSPVSPKPALDLILGLVVGLAVGIGGAIFRDILDTTVKTPDDIHEITGGGAIGMIAYDSSAKKHPLVVGEGAHAGRSESFRQFRTNLQFIDVDSPPRSITFTSSVPDEGKTTTVCNLAITLAQGGSTVLLIEADLRRPQASMYLGLTESAGLTDVLVGSVHVSDVTQQWGGLPLYVLAGGPKPHNPSELLGSKGMAALLEYAEAHYDLVLIDAPPLLPVTDAAVVAAHTSGAVVLVRYGKTHRDQLRRSTDALASVNARLLGCVINMTPKRGADAYHYDYRYARKSQSRRRLPSPSTTPAPGSPNVPAMQTADGGSLNGPTQIGAVSAMVQNSQHDPGSAAPTPAGGPGFDPRA